MPESTPLVFTVADHDRIHQCANGIDKLLDKFSGFEKSFGSLEEKVEKLTARVANVEETKIRMLAVVTTLGLIVGYILKASDVIAHIFHA